MPKQLCLLILTIFTVIYVVSFSVDGFEIKGNRRKVLYKSCQCEQSFLVFQQWLVYSDESSYPIAQGSILKQSSILRSCILLFSVASLN